MQVYYYVDTGDKSSIFNFFHDMSYSAPLTHQWSRKMFDIVVVVVVVFLGGGEFFPVAFF